MREDRALIGRDALDADVIVASAAFERISAMGKHLSNLSQDGRGRGRGRKEQWRERGHEWICLLI
ncbi:hypothetical protein LGH82_12485 [Mesorhizobium sp. PAMC28654]|uniref:hypothetical protein n=1 Tax=Mesorhizobium sp. PAMC28654 TaxID=2880934 RepID=UPI001D0AB478|nr:hypothetical protein [Mesorhizobium sp. PAMC28654]UDL91975.1 hypothetical protein LGH82_12485 [Mesorhizobium sp. PAMC28654]